MSHEFKPGGLALIIDCREVPQMIGKCVELVVRLCPGDWAEVGGREWVADQDSPIAWVVEGSDLAVKTRRGFEFAQQVSCVREAYLMPLRGDFQPERQKESEVLV